jgi:hypothetical protein
MLAGSGFADLPGLQTAVETFEAAWSWGPTPLLAFTNGWISSSCSDPTNTPTWELRPGLLLGQQTSTGQWTNYSATATDGSQIAGGVVLVGVRMQDIFTGSNTQKFWAICVGGRVQASKILGLDNFARANMRAFQFDDNFIGNSYYDWKSFITQTANYQILSTDNFTLFDNTAAAGSVTLTLPAIANGYKFGIRAAATQTFALTSFEGGNLIGSTLTQSTASVAAIGGSVMVYSNPAGTKWIVENVSSSNQTITFA